MISKRSLVIICLISAFLYHFIRVLGQYGPEFSSSIYYWSSIFALTSTIILVLFYFTGKWRSYINRGISEKNFDLLIIWILVYFLIALVNSNGIKEVKQLLFEPYVGLILFPCLAFVIGANSRYFSLINKVIFIYCVVVWSLSWLFWGRSSQELQNFLLMPLFYLIITIPIQSPRKRLIIVIMSISVIILSFTNRAGISRLLISYLIILGYYFILKFKISKAFLNIAVFIILLIPFYFLYQGIIGNSIFQTLFNNSNDYTQANPYSDTRTFLYYEVFMDLKTSDAFIFGKGINAGYYSETFDLVSRTTVEVGFLQTILKIGVIGLILYLSLIISAIFKALQSSKSVFIKSLGLLLVGYVLLFFVENIIDFNLLNYTIWIVIGMCHSKNIRNLTDTEIKKLFVT